MTPGIEGYTQFHVDADTSRAAAHAAGLRVWRADSVSELHLASVDKCLAGGAPGAPATYVGMCHIFCDSVEAFQAGFGPHAQEIMGDIPNYTDLTPVIQISEVVVG